MTSTVAAVLATVIHTGTRATLRSLTPGFDYILPLRDPAQPSGSVMRWEHVTPKMFGELSAVLDTAPGIVTLRDPLASLISTLKQRDSTAVEHVADWLELAKLFAKYPGMLSVRIDHDPDADLTDVATALSFYAPPLPVIVIGETDPTALSIAYANRDWPYIQSAMGDDVAVLRDAENVLRPLLEARGYTDLIWYS